MERNPQSDRLSRILGNVAFVERPFHPTTLISGVRSALRARQRQYEARERMERLREMNETLESRVEERATALQSAQEQLRQSQKMEAIGQLTGGIAHDFNNLLQGITGSLSLLKRRIGQGKLENLDMLIDGAVGGANRAAALTHRLLAFSRRQPLDPKSIEANPLITGMSDILYRSLGERVHLNFDLAPDLCTTLTDPNQLESALLNLCINSRDAMGGSGTITIATTNYHVTEGQADAPRALKPGAYVRISVSDTGSGMDAKTLQRAFDPFFTTKPLGQGTGLGLSMIHGFVRQSEGDVVMRSEIGKGTTVEIYLPCADAPAMEDNILPTMDYLTTAEIETVLVVEDDPVVRGLIVEVLRELNCQVLEASDGPAGVEMLLSDAPITFLITDIGLPGLNGRQVADAGRGKRPDLKVLFVTGYADTATGSHGFLESGMEMLTKPFPMELFASKVREMIPGPAERIIH